MESAHLNEHVVEQQAVEQPGHRGDEPKQSKAEHHPLGALAPDNSGHRDKRRAKESNRRRTRDVAECCCRILRG